MFLETERRQPKRSSRASRRTAHLAGRVSVAERYSIC
jgi:hypothetical protein